MCGISGFVGKGTVEDLARMNASLVHRGPDDSGTYFMPGVIGFGFRRLSIIDLATGNQPLTNENGSIISVFNGEIYNYQTLRKELIGRHTFRTQGDAEVIVHSYEDKGINCFRDFNGMFAIAIWDNAKRQLILARDRFGKKPLYFAERENTIVLSSEIKAILTHPLIKRELNLRSLYLYLTHEYVPAPETIFKGIYKVMPGTALVFQDGRKTEHQYYQITFDKQVVGSFQEALRTFDMLLTDSVRLRMISDVPFGALLSGGLDSSTICYYMQRSLGRPLKTFSIAFAARSFDESAYARKVAHRLGTEHYERLFDADTLISLLDKAKLLLDEPLGDASFFPNYELSRFAREQVTVAVGGDAADELIMGYPTFQAHRLAAWYGLLPQVLRRSIIEPLIRRLPTSFSNISFDYRLKRFILGIPFGPHRRDLVWIGSFMPSEKQMLLAPAVYDTLRATNDFEVVDRLEKETRHESFYNQITYQYLNTYLTDDILKLKDSASMFASLELRVPFLDYRIVDFLNGLPSSMKMRRFTTKYILKELMKHRLPESIVFRKKKGFGIPIADWLRGPLKPFMLDLLSQDRLQRQGLFNYSYINGLVTDHLTGKRDNRKMLWTLLMFQWWYENLLA